MIDLYTWLTPNGRKISIMLEEVGLHYRAIPVDIGNGAQFEPAFLAISPNNKIPVIVDHDGPGGAPLTLFESGAILMYLAEKSGQLLPADPARRWTTLQWLQFQTASLGPMLGQAQHFLHYASEQIPYGMERFGREARRLYGVLDRQLGRERYLAGADYTVADVATWPWIRPWKLQGIAIDEFSNVNRWLAEIEARPAVARERKVLAEVRLERPALTDDARRHLFLGSAAGNGARRGS
jgi:GSH-dependent disulfide-bond oxidoreductase